MHSTHSSWYGGVTVITGFYTNNYVTSKREIINPDRLPTLLKDFHSNKDCNYT